MKQLAILFAVCALLGCKAKTREDILKEKIKAHLSKTMHDFKSYEPVQYGSIDSLFSTYDKTERYAELKSMFFEYKSLTDESLKEANTYLYANRTTGKYYSDKATILAHKLDSLSKLIKIEWNEFKPQFIGYNILHSFRGKNMNGATILTTEYFILDSALNVISTEDLPEKNDK
jgi:hypothetical protein